MNLTKIREYWSASDWKIRTLAFCAMGTIAIWLIWSISGSILNSRYEKRLAEAQKAATLAQKQAQAKISEAQGYHDQGEALKIELEAREREVQTLNNQLSAARNKTAATRIVYVQSKENPQPAIVLSGDPIPDRRRICSGLAEVGIICKN